MVDGTFALGEFLEVTNLAECLGEVVEECPCYVYGTATEQELYVNLFNGDTCEGDLIHLLIPRILAPDTILVGLVDRSIHKALVILVGRDVVTGLHTVDEGIAFLGTHIHKTTDTDFPALCSGVLGVTNLNSPVGLILGIPLVLADEAGPALVRSILRDGNEVNELPGTELAAGVPGTVSVEDVGYGVLPYVEVTYESLCPGLQRVGGREIVGGNFLGKNAGLCIGSNRTGDGNERTVCGESLGSANQEDVNLVGNSTLAASIAEQTRSDGGDGVYLSRPVGRQQTGR